MLDSIIRCLEHDRAANLAIARGIPGDVCDALPAGLAQSPCWIVCHFALADTRQHAAFTGRAPDSGDDAFFVEFGPGSHDGPARERMIARFGSWPGAIDAAEASHRRLLDALRAADPAVLTAPHPSERARVYFPTLADNLAYACWHEGNHGGQLRAWLHAARAAGVLPGD